MIMVKQIKVLSASGSRNFPNEVTAPYLLAKKPSRISVIDAMPKNNAAKKLPNLPGKLRHMRTSGIHATLTAVRVLGKLETFF